MALVERRKRPFFSEQDAKKEDKDDDDLDESWAIELEEELGLHAKELSTTVANESDTQTCQSIVQVQTQGKTHRLMEVPQEVLVNIFSFAQVGRVCKTWSLAMSVLTRRNFCFKLTEILNPYSDQAASVAQRVEMELYDLYKHGECLPKSYGRKARQLLFNLKDSRNDLLRERLLSKELTPFSLVRMAARDMANPQLVRQREEWIKKRTHEVMRGDQDLDCFTESDMFECRSCGSSRTRYRQWRRKAIVDRVRIIVVCLRCPYRWEL